MTALLTALGSGISAKKILEYLMRKSPEMAPRISSALASGLSAEKILKFFSNGQNFDKLKSQMEEQYPMEQSANPMVQASQVRSKNMANDPASQLQRAVPGIAATAGGIGVGMALNHALPNSLKGSTQEKIEKNLEIPQQSPVAPNLPQAPAPIQPEIKTVPLKDVMNKYPGFESKINDLLKTKNNPEAISAYFKKFNPGQTAKIEKEVGKPIQEIIAEYASTIPQENAPIEANKNEMIPAPMAEELPKQEPVKPLDIEETKPIAKGATVISPQGVAEVKEIRNGKAMLEVDGKKHVVNEDELIESPLPEEDLADLYDDLIGGIEKSTGKQVSRNVDWAGYDPNSNELAYKPHGSDKLYAYADISPEDIEVLTNFLTQRKSTGSNFIGAWEAGTESPIGAAMYQLIKKLQAERGGKGNEYKNKYETIYDALEPAKLAAKKKHAERKKKAKKPRID